MEYRSLLETARRHVERQGVQFQGIASKRAAAAKAIKATEAKLSIRLPAELREFYQTVGDGYMAFWQTDPNEAKKPWGSLQVPSLSDLVELYNGWRGLVLYSPEQAEKYGFPYTNDPEMTKRTAARMWHWLPLFEEPNGDGICIDLSDPSCPVVFHAHDWMASTSEDHAYQLGANWHDFLIGWGSVCFQAPASMHWPSCFRPGGVAWDGKEFREPFRVPELAELSNSCG